MSDQAPERRVKTADHGRTPLLYAGSVTADQEADHIFLPFRQGGKQSSFVVAQLGQSLDGRIATVSGDSKYINGEAALRHLHRIRAAVDAVLVGVGTVIADDPLLTVRLVPGEHPVRVILDPRGRMPHDLRVVTDHQARTIVIQGPEAANAPPGCEVLRLPAEDGRIAPERIIAALGSLGLRRVLVEGGAHTVSSFIDAGVVDRLHVLVAPMILGSGKPGLELRPISVLQHARRPATQVRVLEDGNVLFDCDLRSCPNARCATPIDLNATAAAAE